MNGLSPVQHQAIIWTNADLLLMGQLQTNLRENWFKIQPVSYKKISLKPLSGDW